MTNQIRNQIIEILDPIDFILEKIQELPPSRESSLAKTKLQEARFWITEYEHNN